MGVVTPIFVAGGSIMLRSAADAAPKHFELVQYDDRPPTIYNNATRAWCVQSSCCQAYTHLSTYLTPPLRLPPLWARVKALADHVDTTNATALVWLDSDAFFVDRDWCPDFSRSPKTGSFSAIFSPDPLPWHKPINIGFFALQMNAVGKAIARAHWALWTDVSKHWSGFGPAGAECGRDDSNWHICKWGGKWASQYQLTVHVLPRFTGDYTVLPRDTQNTDQHTCNGTVKHLAAGHWKTERKNMLLERCIADFFIVPNRTAENQ